MDNIRIKKGILLPIIIVIVYLSFTQIAYIYSYDFDYDLALTIIYTSLNYFSIFVGYICCNSNSSKTFYKDNININMVIVFCSVTTIVICFNNISQFYPDLNSVLDYILNPGKAYEYVKFINRNQLNVNTSGLIGSFAGVILNILTFTKYYLFGFVIFYWNKLNNKIKCISIVSMVVYFIQSLLIGAMVNVGTLFISIIPFLLYKNYHKNKSLDIYKKIKFKFKITIVSVIFFIVLLYFMGSRNVFKLENRSETSVLTSGLLGLMFYISHGYYGLSQCLNLPFEFTWGQTTFRGITNVIFPYLGISNNFSDSYLFRNEIENGTQSLQVWSTIFPWLASDMTFILIPFVMLLIGAFLKRTWIIAIKENNPFSLVVMGQLLIFCFMIPANNQLFHTFGNAMGTIFIIAIFIYTRKRKNRYIDTW